MAKAASSTSSILFPFGISLSDLDVLSVTGTEGISQLPRFELHLVSEHADINFDDVVKKRATLTMECGEDKTRYFHGIISRFAQGDASPHHVEYYAELVPKCWLLTLRLQSRIFQQKDVQEIVQKVLEDAGFKSGTEFKFDLKNSYSKREYCVQYRESDFNFIARLLEEEGIFYFFQHDENDTLLVMADHSGAHPDCAPDNEALCHERAGELSAGEQYVFESRYEQRVCSGKVSLNDFNFTSPTAPLLVSSKGDWDGALEVYDHPGEYGFRDAGEKLTKVRLQELDARRRVLTGRSNFCSFTSGHKVRLKAGADTRANTLLNCRDDLNDKVYLVMAVTHRGEQRAILARDEPGAGAKYENQFECILFDTPFRPSRATPRPTVQGSQTAIVVGPKGEEIYTDEYGRVKVQFHWDREGQYDDKSSCWIRFAQVWAGRKWGSMFIPRIGQEVIVDFLEGDPDRPIITGRVYNADNMPPYKLPDEKTKSTTKSNSSTGGGGFNEIRFEDKKGKEQVFIHGEKDLDIRVKNDAKEWIGKDRHLIAKSDQLEQVDGDKHLTVKGDRNEKVDGTISVDAGMDMQQKVGMNHALDAGMEIHLKGGMKVIVEAGTQVSLKAGPSFVDIGPSGVSISGPMVNINSGGAAGSGSGCSPDSPKSPKEADTAEPGKVAKPPKPKEYSPAAIVLQQAAKDGTPFCEQCEKATKQAT